MFILDTLKPEARRRRAYLWIAQIDLLLSPAVPRVFIGRQEVAVDVRARYAFDQGDAPPATKKVVELGPIKQFDTGVLFVHNIGQQKGNT